MTSPILQAVPLRRALSLLVLAAAFAVPASATDYVVTSDSDAPSMTTNTPDGMVTLREALIAANSDAPYGDAEAGTGDDTISFADGVGTITLQQGELAITDGVLINGDGDVTITTPGNRPMRLFNITTSDAVALANLDLTGGFASVGGAILLGEGGNLTLADVDFTGNRATDGGALYVSSDATVDLQFGTSFSGNRANGSAASNGGGAIYAAGAVTGDVFASVSFSDNRATVGSGSGGALFVADGGSVSVSPGDPTATMPADARGGGFSFSSNRAARAGGAIEIREGGSVEMELATFDSNFAGPSPGNGGAIHITGAGSATISSSVASGNVATAEGGAYWNSGSGTLTVNGGSLSNNIARGDAADQGGGAIFSDGGDTMIDGASFTANRAIGAAGSGGALFSNGADMFTVLNANFRQNTSVRAGGAIEVLGGTVTITDSEMDGNSTSNAPGNGGGLHISGAGDVTVTGSSVTNNTARNEGGGLWNSGAGSLTVVTTTVDGNSTPGNGGGVYQQPGEDGLTVISNSAITNNTANTFGGGVFAGGAAMAIQNSTISGNTARRGGGGESAGATVSIESTTIAANTAGAGTDRTGAGGGFSNTSMSVRVQLQNTLVADNVNGELRGFYTSMGNNLVETRLGAGIQGQMDSDLYEVDAMIGPLADNGGPTMTHALLAGSPAIDAGMTDFETDQRGELRNDPDDIGAFDFGDGMMAGDGAMLITGVFDGNLPGGTPKAVEFYVTEDIADLSLFGFSSANNGGGATGTPEFTFPMGSASEGDYLYATSSPAEFQTFFGFAADYTDNAANINGDDAIELFQNGAVIDVFGEVATDGTGQPWEYLDGWVYRMDETGPDGSTFVLDNWTYSGINENDDDTSQETATNPWPLGSYSDGDDGAQGQTASKFDASEGPVQFAPVSPNPIRSTGRVQFAMAQSQAVSVELYDVMGRRVQTLYTGTPAAEAVVDVTVDASDLASGVYVVVLQSATVRQTQRVTVAR